MAVVTALHSHQPIKISVFSPPNHPYKYKNGRLYSVCFPAARLCSVPDVSPLRSPAVIDTYRSSYSSNSRPVSGASSTHPMLSDTRLDLPSPFAPRSFPSRPESPSSTSLTVNYVPTKLSAALLSPANTGPYRRKGKGESLSLPKQGGGVEAFRSGEARIGNRYDDEYDGIMHGYSRGKKKMKWTKFKWILLIANILVCRFCAPWCISTYTPTSSSLSTP